MDPISPEPIVSAIRLRAWSPWWWPIVATTLALLVSACGPASSTAEPELDEPRVEEPECSDRGSGGCAATSAGAGPEPEVGTPAEQDQPAVDGTSCTGDGGPLALQPGDHPPACWRPYGPDSPFNRRVRPSPTIHSRSNEIVSKTLSLGPVLPSVVAPDTHRDWFHPIYYSTPADPAYTIHCTNPRWGRCEIEGMVVHIPDRARPAGGSDAHLGVVEQHTGWEYDLWKVEEKPDGGGTLRAEWGGRTRIDEDGLRSDATAAHFGLLAGIVRAEELIAGRIDHALFLLVACSSEEPVLPAAGNGAVCDEPQDAPAMGQLFWLDMSPEEIDALDAPPWRRTILHAMAEYGAYVGDTGGNEAFALKFESATSYTSFGQANPWLVFAGEPGVTDRDGILSFDIGRDFDWASRLKVLDPCEASGTCDAD